MHSWTTTSSQCSFSLLVFLTVFSSAWPWSLSSNEVAAFTIVDHHHTTHFSSSSKMILSSSRWRDSSAAATKTWLQVSNAERNSKTTNSRRQSLLLDDVPPTDSPQSSLDNGLMGTLAPNPQNLSFLQIPRLTEELKGLIVLATVPVMWGTYTPVVRMLYEVDPPVPGFVFSACYFTVAAITTVILAAFQRLFQQADESSNREEAKGGAIVEEQEPSKLSSLETLLKTGFGGVELGFYILSANALQVVGLQTVPSDRGGFLIQMTTILVPLVSALLAWDLAAIDLRTWMACAIAFCGIVTLNLDPSSTMLAGNICASLTSGDVLILGASLLYTMNVIRVSAYSQATNPLELAAAKSTVEAIVSWLFVGALVLIAGDAAPALPAMDAEAMTTAVNTMGADEVPWNTDCSSLQSFAVQSGRSITEFFQVAETQWREGTMSQDTIIKMTGGTVWTGLMATAYVVFAQAYGQRLVQPSDANLIYSLQPIFTAIFAFLLLDERMNVMGFVGGGLILSAVLLVATKPTEEEAASMQP